MLNRRKFDAFLKQIKYDMLIFFREPSFALPILVLPAVFFIIYTNIYAQNADIKTFDVYIPAYVLLISFLTVFFNIGIQIVADKELGVFKRVIVSPASIYMIVLAYVVRGVVVSFIGLGEILLLSQILGIAITSNIVLFALVFLVMIAVMLFYSVFLHGFFKNSRQVMPFTIIMFQYVLFASGLMFPVSTLPTFVKPLLYLNPMYHMNLVLIAVWRSTTVQVVNILSLAAIVIVCCGLLYVQRKQEMS